MNRRPAYPLSAAPLSRGEFLQMAGAAALAAVPTGALAASTAPILRAIPKSGEELPVIGLGTSGVFESMGGERGAAEKAAVLEAMYGAGASVIDTAPSYGNAEAVVGDLVQRLGARGKSFLATKVNERGRGRGIESFEESFRALRTDVIDLMQVHNLVDTATHLAVMREWKAQGRFRYIGITHWQPGPQEALAGVMAREDLDFVQLNYSVDVREPEVRLLELARDRGIAVMVNRPFGRGGLFRAVRGQDVPEWAREELGCDSFAQLMLKFVISHPAVTVAIPGTADPEHMTDNQGAGRGPLPDARQRERIAAIWA